MNFIYDIVLNFNKEYYNFFEWSKKDNIINIKKIPLFLVDNSSFKKFKYDNIIVSNEFINLINDKTYTYSKTKLGPSCLISNGKEVIAILFNLKGKLIKRSSLILDEEEEVLDEIVSDNPYLIDIIKCTPGKIYSVNRVQRDKQNYLIKYIKNENDDLKLKYLYYDYFENDENNINNIKNKLVNEITNNWNEKFNSLFETVKLFNKIKN